MTNDSSTLFNGRWLNLRQRGSWEYVERTNPGGAAVIVSATREGRVLLVEQFRVPIQCLTIEFPAGLVGDGIDLAGEAAIDSARRELLEETGYEATQIKLLMGGPSSAGMSTEHMHFFRASGLNRVHAGGGVGGENIRLHEVALSEVHRFVVQAIGNGFAVDPKVYAGIHFLFQEPDGTRLADGWYR